MIYCDFGLHILGFKFECDSWHIERFIQRKCINWGLVCVINQYIGLPAISVVAHIHIIFDTKYQTLALFSLIATLKAIILAGYRKFFFTPCFISTSRLPNHLFALLTFQN